MAGRIPEEIIARVRERIDIVDIVARHVDLKRAGANYRGLCPFHEEKTPSFNVNSSKQFFHCFGCQTSGDVFSFLMKIEGRNFGEVVQDLARHAGIDIPETTDHPGKIIGRSERQQALDLNLRVAALYQKFLTVSTGKIARNYLKQREIGADIIEKFGLGFAPPSGQVLAKALTTHGIDLEFAEEMGLLSRRRAGPGYYDKFRNRLMFPLVGAAGKVVGFGGRLLGTDSAPKYINSPETKLYRKGEALYGLDQAAGPMRKSGHCVLVEGNFDVLQMHNHGFTNTIAPMGTALTLQQARLIRRFSRAATVVFDGDLAGRNATRRAAKTLLEVGLDVRVAKIPDGCDPDSLVREEGGQGALKEILERALPAVDYVWSELVLESRGSQNSRGGANRSVAEKARIIDEISPLISLIKSDTGRDLYIDRLGLDLGVAREIVARSVRSQGVKSNDSRFLDGKNVERSFREGQLNPREDLGDRRRAATVAIRESVPSVEVEVLKILVQHPDLCERAEMAQLACLLTNPDLRATYSAAIEIQRARGTIDPVELLHHSPESINRTVANIVHSEEYAADGDPVRAFDDCMAELAVMRLSRTYDHIFDGIRSTQEDLGLDGSVAMERLAQLRSLGSEASALRSRVCNARNLRDSAMIWQLIPEIVKVEQKTYEA